MNKEILNRDAVGNEFRVGSDANSAKDERMGGFRSGSLTWVGKTP